MKPWYQKVHFDDNRSYLIEEVILDELAFLPHYHPEYELVYVSQGKGRYIIGDNISDFQPGDLILLGSNLPHSWKRLDDNQTETKFLVIQLNNNVLEQYILNCPEMNSIARLMEKTHLGIYYQGDISRDIGKKMNNMTGMKSFRGLIELLEILRLLSQSDQFQTLASPGFVRNFSLENDERINQVFNFLLQNFNREIRLGDLANITHMTEWAFCRYFKRATQRTFFTYVNEMRIGYACKLLLETSKNMTEISYESGYNSISNFNKQFKSLKGMSPVEFRKQLMNYN